MWKIAVALILAGLAAIVIADVVASRRNANEDRGILLERRQEYVRVMNQETGGGMSLRGAEQDELELDAEDCGPNALRAMVGDDRIVGRLIQAGFRRLRCKGGTGGVDVPAR